MIYLKIMPLLFLAIGAFFSPYWLNFLIAPILIVLFFFIKKFKSTGRTVKILIIRLFKNLIALIIFTFPLFIVRLFSIREGERLRLFWLDIYSFGILQTAESFSRLVVLAVVSFIGVDSFLNRKKLKPEGQSDNPVEVILGSMKCYQEIIAKSIAFFKEKGKKNTVGFIDGLYLSGKQDIKNTNDN